MRNRVNRFRLKGSSNVESSDCALVRRTETIRGLTKAIGVVNGLLAALLAVLGAAVLMWWGSTIRQTNSREEFAIGMFLAAPWLVMFAVALLFALLGVGCWIVYRRLTHVATCGSWVLFFLSCATLPPFLLVTFLGFLVVTRFLLSV